MTTMTTRDDCVLADERDPLAGFRSRFVMPAGVIYLDGNSLGPMPTDAARRAAEVVTEEWGQQLIRAWNTRGWFDLPARLGDLLSPLIGGSEGQTVVTDSTSINLFKALAAALTIQDADRPGRRVIVSERENFPTDLYIMQGMSAFLDRGYELKLIDDDTTLAEVLDEQVAVVALSHVNYRTGALHDMDAVTTAAHRAGALMIWDLCHTAGALPIELSACDVDFAVGCTYKYLNAGPGAPAFIWVNDRHQNRFWQPLSGWWSHQAPFAMAPDYAPASGIQRFLCGTQPIASMSIAECGLRIAAEADLDEVRRKSLALADLLIDLVETRCAGHDLTLVTPREHERRGSHVSFRHPDGYAIVQALIARGVIGDYREPEIIRLGLTPLYLGYADIWDAVDILAGILDTRAWDRPEYRTRGAVT
ncbi:MAG: kynureninase [Propioniciclava sp.]|uniref:kynureninase n=1 Tax=Propioniciclava sp. TaxID=2038686 RepID=UPI0039E3838F